MILVDSNVIIDVLEPDPVWRLWSREQIASAAAAGRTVVNTIIVAELASRFSSLTELETRLDGFDIAVEDIPLEAAFAAGHAFRDYRRGGRSRDRLLADFFIGAHAHLLGAKLLTRDPRFYQKYFPELPLIIPETENG